MMLTLADVRLSLGMDAAGADKSHNAARAALAGVCTDTRTLQAGDLFVALVSPKSDGHDFITQAVAKGASAVVVSRDVPAAAVVVSRDVPAAAHVPVLRVADTEAAYGQIARFWRDKFRIPVVAVTGSVGKTTTKEMLAAAVSPLGPVLKTAASQNNETGVPKTLLQLNASHRAAIIEMGMRGAGQIAHLCAVARPTLGVITVIGENHLELLGTRAAIADAKGEMLEALPPDGIAILNADDPYFDYLQAKTAARVITYGLTPAADYCAENVTPSEAGWRFTVRGVPVHVNSVSRHDVGNALASLAAADALGVALAAASQALNAYEPPPMRMGIVRAPWGGTVLNDAYNAAPASVRSALQTLKNQPGARKTAFLGDMKELGAQAQQAHQELGAAIDALGGLDALFTVGDLAGHIPGASQKFADSGEAAQAAAAMPFGAEDVVLVKGSRAMAMERIADALLGKK